MATEMQVGYEPTAWMRQKVNERLRQANPVLLRENAGHWAVVVLMLSDPPKDADEQTRERWERSCDRCGVWCPQPTDFFTGQIGVIANGHKVSITFGMCVACKALENVDV